MSTALHHNYAAVDGDIILVSSDDVNFHVHSLMLREASPVFDGMAQMPSPQEGEKRPTDHTIHLDEPAFVVGFLMDSIYPRGTFPSVANYVHAWEIANAAEKYMLGRALIVLRGAILDNEELRDQTLRLYKLARKCQWTDVIASSSKKSLDKPLLNLRYIEPQTQEQFLELSNEEAQDLIRLHKDRVTEILRFHPGHISKWDCMSETFNIHGEPVTITGWLCNCGGGGFDDDVMLEDATTLLKNEIEKILDQEPAASALFERRSFSELFKKIVRISVFKSIDCQSCDGPFANEETAWNHFQSVRRRIPSTIFDSILPED
ncbi:hypothetical protein SCHPADRAFT_492702 [Schizopora paradoxa]|uniref:BTB domain-containing protein n=1 Tax=Schizopora paradoxa TaxID=27342 RepID=A0A0H2RND7_9AGAM|nr:hypothetical protein SCHPADRAFT_492702 [Schizopora paradoxa]